MTNPADLPVRDVQTLLAIMRALRTPDGGCPWDLEQTFETIAPYTIEEAYEVADAIANGDYSALRDELGDLLLQVVYHAQMASELEQFTFVDVVEAINEKMIRRHPHVFGDDEERAKTPEKGFWETAKAKERTTGQGALANVPVALPALTRAAKLQAKAARAKFDWPSTSDMIAKIAEEAGEILEAQQHGDEAHVAEEIGDLLFVIANFARHCGVDPEASLRATNRKFERRFAYVANALTGQGRHLPDASLDEMDALWDEAKQKERTG